MIAAATQGQSAVAPDRTQGRHRARNIGAMAIAGAFLVFFWSLVAGLIAPQSLVVPEANPSLSEMGHILRSNLTILAVLAACAALQRFARQEVADGSRPWVRWICDAVVAVFIGLNVSAVGFAIGQLGGEGLIRILPHAWLEVPAFGLGIWGYLLARSDALDRWTAIRIFGTAFVCLLLAAPIEAFLSGGIR